MINNKMKTKSFVKQECVEAITMKDVKSNTSAEQIKGKHLFTCVRPPRLSALFCLRGGGDCTRSIPILMSLFCLRYAWKGNTTKYRTQANKTITTRWRNKGGTQPCGRFQRLRWGYAHSKNTSLTYRPTTVGQDKSIGRAFLISPAPHGLDRTRLRQMNHGKTQAMQQALGKLQRRLNRTTRSDPPKLY